MGKSNIEWTDMVWNPVTGCTKVSEGCANCYAERMAMRFTGHFNVTCHPDRLDQPLHWKKPRRIFVCSMGDLFHKDVLDDFIHDVLRTVFILPKHQFLALTKRPERAREYFLSYYNHGEFGRNLWLGVTAENQEQADKRIPILLQIPAALRFVSIEPMLGPVDIQPFLKEYENINYDHPCHLSGMTESYRPSLDWVIVGAESGVKRRYCNPYDMIEIIKQCKKAGVPVFIKQIHLKMGSIANMNRFHVYKNPSEWPEDLRVREYPC